LATQMNRLDPAPEGAALASGFSAGPDLFGEPARQAASAPKPDAAGSLAAASCGVGVLDREFRLFWCNDTLAAHFGVRDGKAAIGEPAGKLAPESALAEYLAGCRFSEPMRLELARPDGRVLALRVVPYIGTQWLLLSLDITDADRLETKRRDCM